MVGIGNLQADQALPRDSGKMSIDCVDAEASAAIPMQGLEQSSLHAVAVESALTRVVARGESTNDSLKVPASESGGSNKETSSRPPSPPDTECTTPRLHIAPCPLRLRELIPPPNYGTVTHHNIYRASFPQDRNVDFMKTLRIRHILTLVATPPTNGYQLWTDEHKIKRTQVDVAPNKDGLVKTTLESLCTAILFVLDSSHYPLLIHCNQGRHRTGVVIGCLRRIQRWSTADAVAEYETYAFPKAREGDVRLIESFEPDCVFEFAKRNGYFGDSSSSSSSRKAGVSTSCHGIGDDGLLTDEASDAPRFLRRLDSAITNIDMLAAALSAGALDERAGAGSGADGRNCSYSSSESTTSSSSADSVLTSTLSTSDDGEDRLLEMMPSGINKEGFTGVAGYPTRLEEAGIAAVVAGEDMQQDHRLHEQHQAQSHHQQQDEGSYLDVSVTELESDVLSP